MSCICHFFIIICRVVCILEVCIIYLGTCLSHALCRVCHMTWPNNSVSCESYLSPACVLRVTCSVCPLSVSCVLPYVPCLLPVMYVMFHLFCGVCVLSVTSRVCPVSCVSCLSPLLYVMCILSVTWPVSCVSLVLCVMSHVSYAGLYAGSNFCQSQLWVKT